MFSLVTLLLYSYGTKQDSVKRRVSGIFSDTQKSVILDEDLSKPLTERFIEPILKTLSQSVKKILPKPKSFNKISSKESNDKMKKMLRQAGFSISPSEYSLLRVFVIIGSTIICSLICIPLGLSSKLHYASMLGSFASYTILRFHLTSTISKRHRDMEEQLPDVLDLLSINVEAGLGFEQALLHVVNHFEGPLIDELTVTCREMTMGRTRRDALTLFGERCDLSDVKTFVSAVVQAETLGISIKNILRTQAEAIRTNRRNKVEEKAQKISVKIILPMVGLIFPVLLIVLMGPAVLKIAMQFMGK